MVQSNLVITAEVNTPSSAECKPDPVSVMHHLAHELRQPLSTIETAAHYLKMILEDGEPRAVLALEKIQQMVHQMNWIVADAVHYVQAAPPHPQWLDLSEFISEQLAWQPVQQQVEVDWNDCSSRPLVWMDPGQAQHMVRAILSVFRQLSQPGRPVYISLYREGENAVFECSCETPEHLGEHAEVLLQPFMTHLPAGSGLSLASVKRIVEVHSGRISIHRDHRLLKLEIVLSSC